jgi:hypothetical protein
MKHLALVTFIVFLAGGLAACQPENVKPEMTPLQLQAIQSHEFETNKNIAFASVLSVFQDLGYIVASADKDTGFITASSPAKQTVDWLFTGNTYASSTKATAFVEELRPGITKVRLNFVATNKSSGMYGQSSEKDQPITDAKPYEAAFNKIGDAIFVRSGK